MSEPTRTIRGPAALWRLADAATERGEHAAAAALLFRAVAAAPSDAALHAALGEACVAAGQTDRAADAWARAVELDGGQARWHLALGGLLARQGRQADARAAFERARELDPRDPDVHAALGWALHGLGRLDEALGAYEQALALAPDHADAWTWRGATLAALGDLPGAVAAVDRAAAASPDRAAVHRHRGEVLLAAGRREEALVALRRAAKLGDTGARAALGRALVDSDPAAARELLEGVVRADPGALSPLLALGRAWLALGRPERALVCFEEAVARHPRSGEAENNLASALAHLGRTETAEGHFLRASALAPDLPEARNNLAALYLSAGRRVEAEGLLRQTTRVRPRYADAWLNLFHALLEQGRADEALEAARAGHRASGDGRLRSAALTAMLCSDRVAPRRILAEARGGWPEAETVPAGAGRIGVLTARPQHPLVASVLRALDHLPFEVIRFEGGASLLRRLRGAKLDLLLELDGHAGPHLEVLARRAAPVQAVWMGWPATTGVPAVDHLVGDAALEGAALSEEAVVLPLFVPLPELPEVPVTPPPCVLNGAITFGYLGALARVSPSAVARWAAVLDAVPGARLRVVSDALAEASVREAWRRRLVDAGVDPDRLTLASSPDRLAAHAAVDVVLDAGPCSQAMAAFEALWMGVPMVTAPGDRVAGRLAGSVLRAAGRGEWVADDYVAVAAGLAGADLVGLRRSLRAEVAPLADGAAWAGHLADWLTSRLSAPPRPR